MILKALLIVTMFFYSVVAGYAAPSALVDESKISSVEERRILVSIEDEYAKLGDREAKIDSREMQLKTLEAEVDKKLAAMQQLRDELIVIRDAKRKAIKDFDQLVDAKRVERIGELSKMYEKMDPVKAAVLIESLDHQFAVDLLLGIKKKIVGKILNSLPPETATTLSNAFTEISVDDNSGK